MASSDADRSLQFDSIFVVELLGPTDRKTGDALFRSTIQPKGAAERIHTAYVSVSSADRFIPDLWAVAAECKSHRLSPIIHVETHGTKAGLGLDTNSLVPWEALVPPLRAINETSEMNLVVTLAACHGMALVRGLTPLEPSPVWGLFGPNEQIHDVEVQKGYRLFYATLLDTLDLNAAVAALQTGVWLPDVWNFRSAEFFFAMVYGHFLDAHRRPGERVEAERRLVKKLRRRVRKNPGHHVPSDVRRRIRVGLADEEKHFQRSRQRFFMLDRFPKNADRFLVTRETCLEWWEKQRAAYDLYDSS